MLLPDPTKIHGNSQLGEVVCVGSFGERLQREREMRGITLEEIAEATKIGTRSLRALEEQDFDKLPGGIFNKGFVRAYSKYLGIDEDQAVADYVGAVAEAQAAGKVSRPDFEAVDKEIEEAPDRAPLRVPWGALVLVAVLIAFGFAAKAYYSKYGSAKLRREPAPVAGTITPAAASAQTSAPSAPQPASTQPTPPPPQTSEMVNAGAPAAASSLPESSPSATGFFVKVRAREDSWVSIVADGKTITSGVLPANSDKVIHAERELVLKTGNAGGIEVSHNDKPLPQLGPEKQVKTVTFTVDGIRQ